MIARGFKSVIWVAAVGGAALSCYMVSLRVATERNELAKVERQIVEAKRDIRSLQTELGTRGRMTQLEQWNAEVLALSAPSSAQFLKDEFTLARLYRNDPTVADRSAEVRLASAQSGAVQSGTSKPAAPPVVRAVAERPVAQPPMVHQASFSTAEVPTRPGPAEPRAVKPKAKPESTPAAAKPAVPVAPRVVVAATSKSKDAKPATKPGLKGGAKPESLRAPAKPLREAAAAPRAKGKAKVGGGGN